MNTKTEPAPAHQRVDPIGNNHEHIQEWTRARRPDLTKVIERAVNDIDRMVFMAIAYAAGRASVVAELDHITVTEAAKAL